MPSIKRFLPFGFKRWVKENVAGVFNIPHSRYDVPIALMKAFPRKKAITIIDLGASTGSFTLTMDRYCGVKKALLVEPQPKRVEIMKAKLIGSRFSFECAAVSSQECTIEMDVLNWDYSSSILPVRRDLTSFSEKIDLGVRERIQVQASTLDKLCTAHNFDGFIDLLKIDVQGAEGLVIAGATEVLRRTGMIWMELSLQPMYEGCETIESMIRLCREHGFILITVEDCFSGADGELFQVDALFAPSSGFRNSLSAHN